MAIVTNFDDLQRLHQAAVVGGAKSRAWLEFAITMMDSFPNLYRTAKGMNERLETLQKDSDRYRWLTEHAYIGECFTEKGPILEVQNVEREVPIDDTVDAAIDAAMQKGGA